MSDLQTRTPAFGVPILPPADGAPRASVRPSGTPLPPPEPTAVAVTGPPSPAAYARSTPAPIRGVAGRPRDVTDPPRRLLPQTVLRTIMVVANLAALPLGILASVGDWSEQTSRLFIIGATVAPLVSFTAIVLWSAMASLNARRVNSHNRHLTLPGAWNAALSWFAPLVLVVGLSLVNELLSTERETAIDRLRRLGGGDEAIVYTVGAVIVLLVALAMYRPYSVLRKVSRWVSGDQVRFRTWFLAPFFGAALFALVIGFIALLGLADSGFPPLLLAAAWIVAASLPWVFWLLAGNRAMADLEAATQRMHDRALEEHQVEVARVADD